jgi:cysteine desulfurase / selenocysteine lyase
MKAARSVPLEQRMNKHISLDLPLDVAGIREDFPILATEVYGKPLVYLDNAASAQKPKQVVERMLQATYHEYANVHRADRA